MIQGVIILAGVMNFDILIFLEKIHEGNSSLFDIIFCQAFFVETCTVLTSTMLLLLLLGAAQVVAQPTFAQADAL